MTEQESKPQNIIPVPCENNSLRWSWKNALIFGLPIGIAAGVISFETYFLTDNLLQQLGVLSTYPDADYLDRLRIVMIGIPSAYGTFLGGVAR